MSACDEAGNCNEVKELRTELEAAKKENERLTERVRILTEEKDKDAVENYWLLWAVKAEAELENVITDRELAYDEIKEHGEDMRRAGKELAETKLACQNWEQVARLNEHLYEKSRAELAAMKERAEKAEKALSDLVDVQNGPPLITLDKAWNEAIDSAHMVLKQRDAE